jgi:hypothetical protein
MRFELLFDVTCKNQTVILRDGLLGGDEPRHFVPGYDRTVPPGQKPFTHRRTRTKLALMGLDP